VNKRGQILQSYISSTLHPFYCPADSSIMIT
jgi:hypothetical protein